MKIHKKKVHHASFAERLKKKAAFFDKLTLESVLNFGQFKGLNIYFACQTDPEYVKCAMESGIIMLDLQASRFLSQCLIAKAKQKAREREQERTRRAQAERERVRREEEADARAYQSFHYEDAFRRQRERNARAEQPRQERAQLSSVSNEKIHPAYQYDHLPDRVKYGKILRLSGQVTKDYIKSQYRKLALTFHPDKNTQLDEVMQETARVMFVRVQQAYEYFKREYNL